MFIVICNGEIVQKLSKVTKFCIRTDSDWRSEGNVLGVVQARSMKVGLSRVFGCVFQ